MGYDYYCRRSASMGNQQYISELHSDAGTQRFLYRKYAVDVTVVKLNEEGEFVGSGDLNKNAARALWDRLVNKGWSTKRMAA